VTTWFDRQWQILTNAPEERLPLLDGALLIARDEYPELNIGGIASEVHSLAHGLIVSLGTDASDLDRISALHGLLFDDMGFVGNRDDYYDPRNSYLNEVLERRTGIPISLAIIYIEIGRLMGLNLRGVGFPGHFLVRAETRDGLQLIDPFNGGASVGMEQLQERLDAARQAGSDIPNSQYSGAIEELIEPTDNRHILVRMLRNLKAIYLGNQDNPRALRCTDRIVTLLPDSALEYRDRATLYLTLGAQHAARGDFELYLKLMPDAEDRSEVEAQMRDLALVDHTLH
jgi:regulator of sirC expression with transglutaminase-like and TPR domain